jgi:Zn-dependent M28 family amino/carboxypeptidase
LIEASEGGSKQQNLISKLESPFFFSPAPGEEGRIKNIFNQRDLFFEVNLQFKEVRFKDVNIGGIIEGHDPEKKKEFLVLGAHYDHLGKDEKSGFAYLGADDNASGISALLEIGRALMKRKTDLKRSVLLLFFGGEEWGLWGSRYFVNQPLLPLTQVKAMFSLDTLGGKTEEKELFLIGSSIHSSLAQASRIFLEPLGIKEGKDIDQYSFEFGSDHYPFHQKGIPSIDFFASDYKKVHTSRDHLESIDFEKLTDKLIYLTVDFNEP